MKRTILTPEQAAWLTATMERNRLRFGGWSMGPVDDDADDKKDDDAGDGGDDRDADDDADKKDDDQKDWKAEFEAQQRINRRLESRGRKDQARIRELEKKSAPKDGDDQPDADKIREEARTEAQREALNGRVEDKIEAKAAAFADPEDAVAVLLRSHEYEDFIDDGKVDVDAIVDALKELGDKKPHLLAQGGKRFKGDADGGTRKEKAGRPKSLGDAVSQHYQPKR